MSNSNQLYKRNDPGGWCGDPSRGAALGRPTVQDENSKYTGKLYIRHIRLNNGGYDRLGTYFGIGSPLYWVSNDELTVDYMLRAYDRPAARVEVLKQYPQASTRT